MINEQSFCRGGGAAENAKPRITLKSEGRKKPMAAPVGGRGLFQSAKAGSGDQSAEAAVAAMENVSDSAPMANTVQWAARVRRSFSAMRMILSLMSGSPWQRARQMGISVGTNLRSDCGTIAVDLVREGGNFSAISRRLEMN